MALAHARDARGAVALLTGRASARPALATAVIYAREALGPEAQGAGGRRAVLAREPEHDLQLKREVVAPADGQAEEGEEDDCAEGHGERQWDGWDPEDGSGPMGVRSSKTAAVSVGRALEEAGGRMR